MEGYLGEVDVTDEHKHGQPYWALLFIEMYGQIDGAHHKAWVLDQVTRILFKAPVTVMKARWANGHSELRYTVGVPSPAYEIWKLDMKEGGDGPYTYEYDEGVAP